MGLEIFYEYGQTPISTEELDELIPGHLATLSELNDWEQENILQARQWAFSRKRREILTISMIQQLHRRMFDQT